MTARVEHAGGALGERAEWLSQRERGAVLGIRAVFWLATVFGRWPARQLVRVIALYYALFDGSARRASRRWLERVHGRPVKLAEVVGHIRRFAQVTLDRIFLLKGRTGAFEVTRTGNEHLEQLTAHGRGAMLVGAHLGSFEAMRVGGAEERFPIHIVGHFDNARMINALLERLDPVAAARVIHVGGDPVGAALSIRERLEQGHMVAILADRVGLNDKRVEVEFFGAPAAFPAGPFLLAAALKCPVYLVFGLYREPNHYDLFCEPFAERIDLPRRGRAEALTDVVQRYARRLEEYARRAPDNWFNFYDFWETAR
ncbi:MAG: lipid A biosynthesis acyltransferase [Myxococcota bacterium]